MLEKGRRQRRFLFGEGGPAGGGQAHRRPGQSTAIAEWRQEDPGTMPAGDVYGGGSPTGIAFYEGGAMGSSWDGTFFAAEPGRNEIFSYQPVFAGRGLRVSTARSS